MSSQDIPVIVMASMFAVIFFAAMAVLCMKKKPEPDTVDVGCESVNEDDIRLAIFHEYKQLWKENKADPGLKILSKAYQRYCERRNEKKVYPQDMDQFGELEKTYS